MLLGIVIVDGVVYFNKAGKGSGSWMGIVGMMMGVGRLWFVMDSKGNQ